MSGTRHRLAGWIWMGWLGVSFPLQAAPTTRPAAPTSQPATKATVASTRPSTQKAKPAKPASKPKKNALHKAVLPKPRPLPKQWGRLSTDLPPWFTTRVDGRMLGKGRLAYLRVGVGIAKVEVIHNKTRKVTLMQLPVRAGQHTVIAHKRGRLGVRFVRGEEHEVTVRVYEKGKPTRQFSRPAGKFCFGGKCWNLFPGDRLYLRPGSRSMIVPTRKAQLATRPYPAKKGDGFLTLHSFPPGVLLLQGRVYSTTPVSRLPLRPGRYSAMVLNGFLQAQWKGTLEIKAGQNLRRPAFLLHKQGGTLLLKTNPPVEFWIDGRYRGWTPNFTLPLKSGRHLVQFLLPSGKVVERVLLVPKGKAVLWNMKWKK